jgi:hypothetical protein
MPRVAPFPPILTQQEVSTFRLMTGVCQHGRCSLGPIALPRCQALFSIAAKRRSLSSTWLSRAKTEALIRGYLPTQLNTLQVLTQGGQELVFPR